MTDMDPAPNPFSPTPPASAEPPAPASPSPAAAETHVPESGRPTMAERIAAKRASYKPGKPDELDKQDVVPTAERMQALDRRIEEELEAAMADFSGKDLLVGEAPHKDRRPRGGNEPKPPQKGKILKIHHTDIFVELPGGKSQGLMTMTQFPEGPPEVGAEVEFHIERFDSGSGMLILSRKGAAIEADWSTVHIGQVVEVRPIETNKGGLAVDVNGIRGFLPMSQIDLGRVEFPSQYLNQRLLCMVTEVNPEEKNLVVSRKALLERDRQEQQEKLWQTIQEGQVHKGIVRNIKPFGAFVDIGGMDGLVPIGEMSWKRIQDPSEVVQLGQAVEVAIIRLDRETRKLTLSLRKLMESPWKQIGLKYPPRSVVSGTVTRVEPQLGAFVELEPGIEGLIHISQLAETRIFNASNVIKPGQTVETMVVSVDPDKQRIGLSLKELARSRKPVETKPAAEPEVEDEGPAEPVKPRKRTTPLRGGIGSGGPLFPNLPGQDNS